MARYHSLTFDAKTRQLKNEPDERSARWRRVSMAATCCAPTVRIFRPKKHGGSTPLSHARERIRCMKSPLSERPIFHHLEHRVESHIFLCVLAYHLLVAIETTLLRQEIHTSWATVRDLLATNVFATIISATPTRENGVLRIRRSATPEQDHRVLERGALGVPTEIIRPVKTWEKNQPNSD